MNVIKIFVSSVMFCAAISNAEMFAGYDSFCNIPVVIGNDPQIATAQTDQNGKPIIHIDPGAISNWTTSRMFTLAHECAHHKLGHTSALGQSARYNGGTAKQELEADCWAARALKDLGDWDDIKRVIIDHSLEGAIAIGGYPSGIERANVIKRCVESKKTNITCKQVTVPCSHAMHQNGDLVQCQHHVPAHNSDLVPCSHACFGPYGQYQCHPAGDLVPCQHVVNLHANDVVQCSHPLHSLGDIQTICE